MTEVKALLAEVVKKTDVLKTARSLYGRQLAPDFNTFNFVNTSELGLSRILADLLDPNGSHGQRDVFLRLFIQQCLPSIQTEQLQSIWQPYLNNLSKTEVHLEKRTLQYRYMDIYLEAKCDDKNYAICIENKPYAVDQYKQLTDYAIEIESNKPDAWHLIYLAEYNAPSEDSASAKLIEKWKENNNFTWLHFSDLVDWLKFCQTESQNHQVTNFLSQFSKFIQTRFMGIKDMNEENAIVESINKNIDTIDASIKISNAVIDMKKLLIKKLKDELLEAKIGKEQIIDFSNFNDGTNRYASFSIKAPSNKEYITFEFQGLQFNSPILGIQLPAEQEKDSHPKSIEYQTLLANQFTDKRISSSSWWLAYFNFEPNNWNNSSEPWQMIKSGEMVEKITTEMNAIYDLLKEAKNY